MENLLNHLKFLKSLLDTARQRGDESSMDYLMTQIDKVIDSLYELGATSDQIDVALV